jgi:hypothetical protein
MYEAIEHWKQYKLEKELNKSNKVKFNHLEIFNVTISYVYIVSLLSIFMFCVSIIVEKY